MDTIVQEVHADRRVEDERAENGVTGHTDVHRPSRREREDWRDSEKGEDQEGSLLH